MTATLDRFREVCRDRHDYARQWKERTGGRVLGYFCTYAPEEIVDAAGALPVRVFGSHESVDQADPYVFDMYCPFSRDCISQAIRGRYEYLDGTMLAQTCLHIRNTFWAWQKVQPGRFHRFLPFPNKVQSPRAVEFATEELRSTRGALEDWVGHPVSDAAIRESTAVYDENRALLGQLYELRKSERPPLTGREAMEVVLAAQLMDKREHSELLRRLLDDLATREIDRDPGVRLMIVGSEDDDTELLAYAEDLGATFVIDEHCTGTRYFMSQAPDDADPVRALAQRYIGKPPCPSRDWDRRTRDRHTLGLARVWGAQGALLVQQRHCDPHELDMPSVKSMLEANGIPTLFLEVDVAIPLARFGPRIEAFLRSLGAKASS